jgi:murein L,D-transpeptidase YafK
MPRLSRRLLLLFAAALACGARRGDAAEPLKADRVRVLKAQRMLELLRDGAVLKTYPIALGPHPRGAKHRRSDGRTPEGLYMIDGRTTRTPYHRALHISYPNYANIEHARAVGVAPGGAIFIHGMPRSFGHHDPVRFFVDWTDGCIAVGNIAIEEIWDAVDDGTLIEILP